jgi:hypothetical protein
VLKGVERPAYDRIRKPALAIYALDDVRSTYPNFESFDAENKARAERQIADLKPWQKASMSQFLREVEHGRIVVLDACNQYLFLTNESEVVRLTQGFLSESIAR